MCYINIYLVSECVCVCVCVCVFVCVCVCTCVLVENVQSDVLVRIQTSFEIQKFTIRRPLTHMHTYTFVYVSIF